MPKNYLDHEVKVKYIDDILSKSKDWQWFIKHLEETYEITEIKNWNDFLNQRGTILDLLDFFIKISIIEHKNLIFNNKFFNDIYLIADLSNNKASIDETMKNMNYEITKLLCIIIYITSLENKSNEEKFIFDIRLLNLKNAFKLINIDDVSIYEEEIVNYLQEVNIEDIQKYVNIFKDNIGLVDYKGCHNFLEENRNKIINANAFTFERADINKKIYTYEEQELLSMLDVSINDDKIIPMISYTDGTTFPNFKKWTIDKLLKIKNYFDHEIANFVIETISYVLYKEIPSLEVFEKHMTLAIEKMQKEIESYDKFNNSSFEFIASIINDNKVKYTPKEFMMEIHKLLDLEDLKILQKKKLPLSKIQKQILKDYYENSYKEIQNIQTSYEFDEYLSDPNVINYIDTDDFIKVSEKFRYFINEEEVRFSADLFIKYMKFLFKLNNVDKQMLNYEMIQVQQLWELEHYELSIKKLQSIEKECTIDNSEIEKFNKAILKNIGVLSNSCMISKENGYISVMENISSNPLSIMVSRVILDEKFPYNQDSSEGEYREVDKLNAEIVEKIKRKYGYKFLNSLDTHIYVDAIMEGINQRANWYFTLFHKDEILYKDIKDQLFPEFDILEYDENIKLAHVTQLFPILEIKIKEMGMIVNIFPFKKDESKFMFNKDPSSILREMLEEIYKQLGSFEHFADILFIYNYMYNAGSLNIRNEVIHGRRYLNGNNLKFAFKVTLAALAMIIKRIELLKNNE